MDSLVIYENVGVSEDTISVSDIVADLYKTHHVWLMGWLSKKMGSGCEAADLMHDTFSRVLQKDNLNTIQEPRAYLTTIAHGVMVNHVRRRDIESAYLEILASYPQAESPSSETLNIMIETLTRIDEMLDGLPDRVKNAFLWCQLEGLTHAQIAEKLSVSVSSVRQYIAKALLHCIKMAND